jgi:hypothetical protein
MPAQHTHTQLLQRWQLLLLLLLSQQLLHGSSWYGSEAATLAALS